MSRALSLALLLGLSVAGSAQARMPDGVQVGAPRIVENLTVFPILATDPAPADDALGPVETLDAALEAKRAVVRERNGGGQVASLVIDNRGDRHIYVLAGTVVKGGKQDRVVGQDFVIAPREKVAVDAYCVEQGRWHGTRDGKSTGGRFGAMKQLAPSRVRAASQHEKNQGRVWNEVARTNQKNKKASDTGTLMATLDAGDVAQQRARLVKQAKAALRDDGYGRTVGVAYAVDGDVRGARWFASHRLYATFEDALMATAATDAITAREGGAAKQPPALAPQAVDSFVSEIEAEAASESEQTAGDNLNEYKRGKRGYGTKTRLKRRALGKPISHDYLKREEAPEPPRKHPPRRNQQRSIEPWE